MELLVAAGADVNIHSTKLGDFPLSLAASMGHHRILEQLIKAPSIDLDNQVNGSVSERYTCH